MTPFRADDAKTSQCAAGLARNAAQTSAAALPVHFQQLPQELAAAAVRGARGLPRLFRKRWRRRV
jgi:hypothetical protein